MFKNTDDHLPAQPLSLDSKLPQDVSFHPLSPNYHSLSSLRQILTDYLEVDQRLLHDRDMNLSRLLQDAILRRYFKACIARVGEIIFDRGEAATKVRPE